MKAKQGEESRSSTSMRQIMLLMMVSLVAVTIILFVLLVIVMRLMPSLNDAAYRSMYNQSAAQASRVGSELNSISRSVLRTSAALGGEVEAILTGRELPVEELGYHAEASDECLTLSYEILKSLLDEQAVTGAFVVLRAEYAQEQRGQVALYLRNPVASTSSGALGVTMLRGPSRLSSLKNLALDQHWSYGQPLTDPDAARFYTEPIGAALTYPKAGAADLGYWSTPFRTAPSDIEIITYSVPLLGGDGELYGVCGVEISLSTISRITPSGDLPFAGGFYLFGSFAGGTLSPDSLIANDLPGQIFLDSLEESLPAGRVDVAAAYDIYSLRPPSGANLLAAVVEMSLYTRNSPFLEEEYCLYVLAPRDQVLEMSQSMTRDILVMLVVSAFLSMIGAIVLSSYFGNRIERLARAVKQINPEKPAALPKTRILELDLLSGVLEQMNTDVAAHAARMSTIVDSVGMPMGAFEILAAKNTVFLTDSLFRLLEIPHGEEESQYIPTEEFQRFLPQVYAPMDQGESFDFPWIPPGQTQGEGQGRWLRLRRIFRDDYVSGTVLDITEEVQEKERLEYERNYDPLTKLLNRNAYSEMMTCLMNKMPDRMGVFLFGDLDNLKTVNDTFGHDTGDRYIQMAAGALGLFSLEGGVVARISGDEFAVYLHGGSNRRELREKVDAILEKVRSRQMTLPDGNVQQVRISVGLAYYPVDADNVVELMKYADYAMYEIKHSSKGGTHEFNRESFERNGSILNKPGQLDYLLDKRRTRFAFQPIVEAATGKVMGFEALMRPQTREQHTPGQIISLARNESKLPQLERLTLFSVMEWVREHKEEIGDAMLFFNSLPCQVLEDEEYEELQEIVEECGCRLVMEIHEEEQASPDSLQKKVRLARGSNVRVALDNFGSGSSNFINLLSIRPDYVKIDMSIVRGIDADEGRRTLLKSIVEYAAQHGMDTIAEGVETYGELRTVVTMGVRFVQGFYLCHPEFNLVHQLPDRIARELMELTRHSESGV